MMMGHTHQGECLYASGALRDGRGQSLRPGGPQLTARAVFCGNWQPGQRVIDIGCGNGGTLDYLRRCGLQAIGVDISQAMLRQTKRQDNELDVVQASGDDLPFADASADGILAECSLSLLPNAAKALSEFHRVLRPGGRLVVTDVYARHPQTIDPIAHDLPPCFSGVLEKERTIRQLETVGFGIDNWEDHSDVLKAFITRFIFEHGSLEALWGGSAERSLPTGRTGDDRAERTPDRLQSLKTLRPGYALLVARKGND
jgi:SAM-dependent methyltransferase